MPRRYVQLDFAERERIADMRNKKIPVDDVAAALGRHRSTIYREIKRNHFRDRAAPFLNGYYAQVAQRRTAKRRARLRKMARCAPLRVAVIDRLRVGWSPEQIAGRLAVEPEAVGRISHEAIYRFVYSKDSAADELWRLLPERRRQRRPRRARKGRSGVFPESRHISNRSDAATKRCEFGHWECDLLQFRREYGKRNVTSLVERQTRYVVLLANQDRQSTPVLRKIGDALTELPAPARRSVTFDRGTEFALWRGFSKLTGAEAWFCSPSAPWQKGTVENTNRRSRRALPRDRDPGSLRRGELHAIAAAMNATPRKRLGFRTPVEAFKDVLRAIVYKDGTP